MKILIIQERGRHEKNREFREALNFQRAFKHFDVEVVVWGLNYDNFNTPFQQVAKDVDIIFLLENYESGRWVPDLSRYNQLKVFWSIDSHCILKSHVNTCRRHGIHICLNAIDSHQGHFSSFCKTHWFPNAYPDDLIFPMPDIQKTVDVGFCGNFLNRKNWVDLLGKKYGLTPDVMVIGNDMVRAINGYKIHFNRNISNDINYRTFETLGCQTLLLTNHTENLEQLFTIGEELITYTSEQDLLEKVKYYLEHQEERERIALKGHQRVKQQHTYKERAKTFLEMVKNH